MSLYVGIYDKKAKIVSMVHEVQAEAVAVREFMTAMHSKDSYLSQYPDDFNLVKLADFDNKTCKFSNDYKVLKRGVACVANDIQKSDE